jgi:hypothetical protein
MTADRHNGNSDCHWFMYHTIQVNMLASLIYPSVQIISSMFPGSLFSLHFIPRYHMEKKAPIHISREIEMKKTLLVMFIVLFTAASGFCGEFENTLKNAEQGVAEAQFSLGILYDQGIGVSQDYEQAVYWVTKAAEQGYAKAQFFLGGMYSNGQGVTQDDKQAAYWITKAAEQGFAEAQFILGAMYILDMGVPLDHQQAVYWYTKAAEQGHASAQNDLWVMYYNGQGVPQNFKLAYVWLNIAAATGDENLIKARDIISKKLSPQQLSEAQELAAQIQHKIDNPTLNI